VAHRRGDAFAVLLFVMHDRNSLGFDVVGNVVASSRALHVIQTDGAENQLVATRGDVRAGGCRRDHQDAFVLIDVGGRLGRAGTQVADYEGNAIVDDLVGHRHGLFRVARVVVDHALKLGAVYTTGLVDLLDGHVGANELHFAVLRHSTGHRAGKGDLDGVRGHRVTGATGQGNGRE